MRYNEMVSTKRTLYHNLVILRHSSNLLHVAFVDLELGLEIPEQDLDKAFSKGAMIL